MAVLVDEYDKPILDALDAPEVARANRDYLRGLYGVIKDLGRACAVHVPDRDKQVLEGEPPKMLPWKFLGREDGMGHRRSRRRRRWGALFLS